MRRRALHHAGAGLLAVAALLAAGCGDEPAEPARPAPSGALADSLAGTGWELQEVVSGRVATPAVAGADLRFAGDGALSGGTGCNSFSGRWRTVGDGLRLDAGAMTRRACGDESAQAQEDAVLAAIAATRGARVGQQVLTLTDAGGAPLARYGPARTDLSGTTWSVTGVNNGRDALVSTSLTERLTLGLAADGTVSGSDGCGQLAGTWTQDGDDVRLEVTSSDATGCPDDAAALARQYVAALGAARTAEVRSGQLTMRDAGGAMQVTASVG